MNQININAVPAIPMRIYKKGVEISWASDAVTRENNSLRFNKEVNKAEKENKNEK